ncbi:MAG: NUDIX domain-containing protein [Micrococcales bacterium]|nr:NUDIX domain-containing protein [Micrococcales bacterium]
MRTNVPCGIRVVAIPSSGRRVELGRLEHGQHPDALLSRAGWEAESIVSATLLTGGALELAYHVTRHSGIRDIDGTDDTDGTDEVVPRDPGIGSDEAGEGYQRVAAYALVTSDRGALMTQFNSRTHVAGEWGPPGGGLDVGESPVDGVHREVWEETGQRVALGGLVAISSSHWVGRAPSGIVEDFHAVRIVYRATCPAPQDIVIHDVDGTTGAARWVPLEQVRALPLTRSWRDLDALSRLAGPAT